MIRTPASPQSTSANLTKDTFSSDGWQHPMKVHSLGVKWAGGEPHATLRPSADMQIMPCTHVHGGLGKGAHGVQGQVEEVLREPVQPGG